MKLRRGDALELEPEELLEPKVFAIQNKFIDLSDNIENRELRYKPASRLNSETKDKNSDSLSISTSILSPRATHTNRNPERYSNSN